MLLVIAAPELSQFSPALGRGSRLDGFKVALQCRVFSADHQEALKRCAREPRFTLFPDSPFADCGSSTVPPLREALPSS